MPRRRRPRRWTEAQTESAESSRVAEGASAEGAIIAEGLASKPLVFSKFFLLDKATSQLRCGWKIVQLHAKSVLITKRQKDYNRVMISAQFCPVTYATYTDC